MNKPWSWWKTIKASVGTKNIEQELVTLHILIINGTFPFSYRGLAWFGGRERMILGLTYRKDLVKSMMSGGTSYNMLGCQNFI